MSSTYPHKLKEFVLKEFQKHLDEEPPIDGEKLTIKNYFHFFHETDVEEQLDKLLIEGDIKAINDYLFLNLYMLKFFRTVEHDEYDTEKSLEKLKKYVSEQELKREMMYNN
ncbi:hypothetical protein N9V16_03775 [SAR116 cluster bacterium]|nr:hypothetical protein [SAR116 cluster bacterium]